MVSFDLILLRQCTVLRLRSGQVCSELHGFGVRGSICIYLLIGGAFTKYGVLDARVLPGRSRYILRGLFGGYGPQEMYEEPRARVLRWRAEVPIMSQVRWAT